MQRRIDLPAADRHRNDSKNKLMERRLVMIDKPTKVTTSSSADVPRVGGEDKSRAYDINSRTGGVDETREIVDDQSPNTSEKN